MYILNRSIHKINVRCKMFVTIYHNDTQNYLKILFCVEVLRPSQPNGVMPSSISLPNQRFTGQDWTSKWLTSILHFLSSETNNCPSWISRRKSMTVENISWSIFIKECRWPGGGWTRNLLITYVYHMRSLLFSGQRHGIRMIWLHVT